MTYLALVKKLGLTKLIICLFDELGYPNREIVAKLQITEPTIYNARKSLKHLISGELTTSGKAPAMINESALSAVQEVQKAIYGNLDVQKIVDAFRENFGTTSTSKYDRFAANRLAKKYGADNIIQIIEVLAKHAGDQYVPTVNSVRQIEQKWVNISNFFNRLQQNQPIDL